MDYSKNINYEVLNLVNKIVEQRGLRHDELGRRIGLTYSGTHKMLDSKKLTVNRLKDLTLALEYNFFASLAQQLNLPEPDTKTKKEKELEKRIQELEIENRILMKILRNEK